MAAGLLAARIARSASRAHKGTQLPRAAARVRAHLREPLDLNSRSKDEAGVKISVYMTVAGSGASEYLRNSLSVGQEDH